MKKYLIFGVIVVAIAIGTYLVFPTKTTVKETVKEVKVGKVGSDHFLGINDYASATTTRLNLPVATATSSLFTDIDISQAERIGMKLAVTASSTTSKLLFKYQVSEDLSNWYDYYVPGALSGDQYTVNEGGSFYSWDAGREVGYSSTTYAVFVLDPVPPASYLRVQVDSVDQAMMIWGSLVKLNKNKQ